MQVAIWRNELLEPPLFAHILRDKIRQLRTERDVPILIDGWPRTVEQLTSTNPDKAVGEPRLVVWLDCNEERAQWHYSLRNDPSRGAENLRLFEMRYAQYKEWNPHVVSYFQRYAPERFERVVVMQEFRATLNRLCEVFVKHGFA